MPGENRLVFELMLLGYLLMTLFLQYVNLYRTVWWLPYGPSTYALNFYLMDCYLILFIVLVSGWRLIAFYLTETDMSKNLSNVVYYCDKLLRSVVIVGLPTALVWVLWHIYHQQPVLINLFLCYPVLFVVSVDALTNENSKDESKIPAELAPESVPQHRKTRERFSLETIHRLTSTWYPQHKCQQSTSASRQEADFLRHDFNRRIKVAFLNSLICAYYVGFMPVWFAQKFLHYDAYWVFLVICCIWFNSFMLLLTHLMPVSYCDTLHQCAQHLGSWKQISSSQCDGPQITWSDMAIWPQGVCVRTNKLSYRAEGIQNTAIPGNVSHSRFYFMFHNGLRFYNCLTIIQALVVFYQLTVLIRFPYWNQVLIIALLLFANYYILFRLLRDRHIMSKVYSRKL